MSKPQFTLKNRTIFCRDNLEVMRGINSNSIDLIYLDPPFNKGRQFHAPIGGGGESTKGAGFDDIWKETSVKDEWHNQINDQHPKLYKYLDAVGDIGSRSAKYYLIYMAIRLLEMYRILKNTGSIYLHCDPTAGHYLKLLMDCLFGNKNFRNEIIWGYPASPSAAKKNFPSKHDTIFRYSKSGSFVFNHKDVRVPYSQQSINRAKYAANKSSVSAGNEIKLLEGGKLPPSVWTDIQQSYRYRKQHVRYPTQKPLALLERIIKASSNEEDLVLDPFCGCATTCVAAERLKRQWIGIDVSEKAYELVKMRLEKAIDENRDLPERIDPILRKDMPKRTDLPHKTKPTKEDKQILYGKQSGNCAGCKTHFDSIRHLHIDHYIPQSQGGSHERINLQLLCASCNSMKGDRPMEYLIERLKNVIFTYA